MNAKFLGAISLAAAIAFTAVIPAEAQRCNGNGGGNSNGNRGNHFGWRNSNKGNHSGWRNNPDRFADRMQGGYNQGAYQGAYQGAFNRRGYSNVSNSGYGAFGANGIAARPYWGQQTNLSDKVTKIQERLASGNISPDRAARLQAELARLQGQQTGLTSYWTNRLTSEQQYLQQLLSSRTLSPQQQSRVQDRLNRITNVQSGITSGTGFNQGSLSSLRNILGF